MPPAGCLSEIKVFPGFHRYTLIRSRAAEAIGSRYGNSEKGECIMIRALGAALSGFDYYQKKLDVAANNIANAETPGYKKSIASAYPNKEGTIQTKIEKVDTPGTPMYSPTTGEQIEGSNVNLAEEIVDTMIAKTGAKANLKSLQAYDEIMDSIMKIKS